MKSTSGPFTSFCKECGLTSDLSRPARLYFGLTEEISIEIRSIARKSIILGKHHLGRLAVDCDLMLVKSCSFGNDEASGGTDSGVAVRLTCVPHSEG
jgi:hypothetical protein